RPRPGHADERLPLPRPYALWPRRGLGRHGQPGRQGPQLDPPARPVRRCAGRPARLLRLSARREQMTVTSELKALVDSWEAANRAGDVEAILGHYADDLVAFDAILQLQFKGREVYKAHWKSCLEMCPGP